MIAIPYFFLGISTVTFAASGLFFLKFWTDSDDRFFLYFAIACWLISFERIVVLVLDTGFHVLTNENEFLAIAYLIRLSAYVVILMAIFKKNRPSSK